MFISAYFYWTFRNKLLKIQNFLFMKMHLNISSAKGGHFVRRVWVCGALVEFCSKMSYRKSAQKPVFFKELWHLVSQCHWSPQGGSIYVKNLKQTLLEINDLALKCSIEDYSLSIWQTLLSGPLAISIAFRYKSVLSIKGADCTDYSWISEIGF